MAELKKYTKEEIKSWEDISSSLRATHGYDGVRVTFTDDSTYQYTFTGNFGSASVGCHVGSLYGVGITPLGGYQNGIYSYSPSFEPPEAMVDLMLKGILKRAAAKKTSSSLEANGASIFILGDAVNRDAPAKKDAFNSRKIFDTTDFINWLITNKIGVVFASPIVYNSFHMRKSDLSLGQVFFWIPPEKVEWILPGTAAVYNYQEPGREEWAAAGKLENWDFEKIKEKAMPPKSLLFAKIMSKLLDAPEM